jgi:galactokinase
MTPELAGVAPAADFRETFRRHFGAAVPNYFVRAPGRVNLIGEHTDYNGLPVFPMALQRECRLLVRARRDSTVHVADGNPEFPARAFDLAASIDPYPGGDWGNYVKAAGQALVQWCGQLRGFDAVVSSDIPIAAGLSSSSALVVASALATLRVNEISVDALELMSRMAEAERYVGLRGGGMDQAICLGAVPGSACRIDFDPLRLTPVAVPQDWRFVVAYSLTRAPKSGSVRESYNLRTRQCREALAAVAARLDLVPDGGSYSGLLSRVPAPAVIGAAEAVLDATLLRRFRHVVTEGVRVNQAQTALIEADIAAFGRLMVESHCSLREDYEVSCPELDELVEIALRAGAWGARLTGAGFGGCIVALTDVEHVALVLEALQREFYADRAFPGRAEDQFFTVVPSGGATAITL